MKREKGKVTRHNFLALIQQPQEEVQEVREDPIMSLLLIQQLDSSSTFTPRWVRSLVNMYETWNMQCLSFECYKEATKQEVWIKAMEEDIKIIESNNYLELIHCLYVKYVIGLKWVYKTKLTPGGTIQKE